jgi:hypothetical protein
MPIEAGNEVLDLRYLFHRAAWIEVRARRKEHKDLTPQSRNEETTTQGTGRWQGHPR